MIEAFCRSYGKKIYYENMISYGFPEPFCIQNPMPLESIGAGFRKNYLLNVSQSLDRTKLLGLKNLPYQEARQSLMKLMGVGKKVADCTLLYSLDFLEAFPIDTWIKKGLQKFYFNGKKLKEREMEEFVTKYFGPFAGYAQLYLYHFWRHHPF
jgi:N-glycosylase/DNA lyase